MTRLLYQQRRGLFPAHDFGEIDRESKGGLQDERVLTREHGGASRQAGIHAFKLLDPPVEGLRELLLLGADQFLDVFRGFLQLRKGTEIL